MTMQRFTAAVFATAILTTCLSAPAADKTLIEWRFAKDGDFLGWNTVGNVADYRVQGGALRGRATGGDPILVGPTFDVPAAAMQYFEIALTATADADAELYWTETLTGQYGGFSPAKHRAFGVPGDGREHVYRIWPFWQAGKRIIRMRIDPPNAGQFAIRWIRIAQKTDAAEATAAGAASFDADSFRRLWTASGDVAEGPKSPIYLSPLLSAKADEANFACVRMSTRQAGAGRLYCAKRSHFGWESETFPLRGDGAMHSYNIDLTGLGANGGDVIALGLQLPGGLDATTRIESISLGAEPQGPAEAEVATFGPTEGINRAGRPAGVACTVRNWGGRAANRVAVTLETPPGVVLLDAPTKTIERLSVYSPQTVYWKVRGEKVGKSELRARVNGADIPPVEARASIEWTEPPRVVRTGYVPEPRPVRSKYEIGVFYFPGWPEPKSWQPILNYPNRKPILGWYDEANPECADWQIKWAAEHGVSFFLVDWYWCKGQRHLEHWVKDAYGKARYRKHLKWCVMWANHNAPGTHSLEDWRQVTQYWLDHCFNMPEYYRIDNKPAVFMWAPENVRNDLGGSQHAAKLYALSQQMAKDAGYPGIYFAAMSSHDTAERCAELRREGYEGYTQYHGFQLAWQRARSDRFPFAALLDTCPEYWAQQASRGGSLRYFPIVDSGWDARPWHGEKSLVAYGRTPELFGKLCRQAREFADRRGEKIICIGPSNEWGEGSYIEPYAEYGFADLDQLRAAFCEPGDWPPNVVPSDVGLGPYDLPMPKPATAWDFNDGKLEGWTANSDLADVAVRDGLLVGRSTGRDPILQVHGLRVEADLLRHLRLKIRCDKPSRVQIFWETAHEKMSEQTSTSIDIPGDGQLHEYTLDLGANPRWRGVITQLRIDPTTNPGVRFAIDHVRFAP